MPDREQTPRPEMTWRRNESSGQLHVSATEAALESGAPLIRLAKKVAGNRLGRLAIAGGMVAGSGTAINTLNSHNAIASEADQNNISANTANMHPDDAAHWAVVGDTVNNWRQYSTDYQQVPDGVSQEDWEGFVDAWNKYNTEEDHQNIIKFCEAVADNSNSEVEVAGLPTPTSAVATHTPPIEIKTPRPTNTPEPTDTPQNDEPSPTIARTVTHVAPTKTEAATPTTSRPTHTPDEKKNTPTPTKTRTSTPTPTKTQERPTPTQRIETHTPESTNTPTKTRTNTPTKTRTNTPENTATNTPTKTATKTATNTPTKTRTNTPTNTRTNTPENTATSTATATRPKDTPTNTQPAKETKTNTPTKTKERPTNTPTNTPTDTPTETPTNTPKPKRTDTPRPTATGTVVVKEMPSTGFGSEGEENRIPLYAFIAVLMAAGLGITGFGIFNRDRIMKSLRRVLVSGRIDDDEDEEDENQEENNSR